MISVIHTSPDERVGEDEEFLIPAGGRRMEMDWKRVTAAFQRAVERLGWDADLEVRPERQYVLLRVPRARWKRVARTTSDFYSLVEDAIGTEPFMSIWIDFASREPCSTLPIS
jgi:hypothetical protein